ncbi:hypothetical protein [Kitasatospora griseola]|uniref:hypothetical protein n=1 Tax=Kitasatospora griseola TaxID=2064 RepID=UPI003658D001
MTARRFAPSVASVKKATAVAAIMLAATTVAGGTAWADDDKPVVPCANGSVHLPGENAVENAPAHNGHVELTTSSNMTPALDGDTAVYRVWLWAKNNTGAAYQHVTVVPVIFTQLGVMNTSNTKVNWVKDSGTVELPTRMGCDPSIWGASGALDTPLADGETVRFELTITAPKSVASQITGGTVLARGAADGDRSLESNHQPMPRVDSNTGPVSPSPSASASSSSSASPSSWTSPSPSASASSWTSPSPSASASSWTSPSPSASASSWTSPSPWVSPSSGTGTKVLSASVPTNVNTEQVAAAGNSSDKSAPLAAGALALTAAGGVFFLNTRRRSRGTK